MMRKKHELMVEGDSKGKGQQPKRSAIVVLIRGTKSVALQKEVSEVNSIFSSDSFSK